MMAILRLCLLVVAAAVAPGEALSWTLPVSLSPFGPECTRARISRGAGGAMHIVWVDKSNWDIYYRFRAANGAWGPSEPIAVSSAFAASANVLEDAAGRANVWYAGAGLGGTTDLFQAVKTEGSWNTTALFASSAYNEDYPTARTDSLGYTHLVYFRSASSSTSDYGSVIYRIWDGSSWSSETVLGSLNTKAYYHRPDMSVDSAGNVHVFWAQDAYTLVYRKKSSGTWQPLKTVGTTSIYIGRPTISAAAPNSIIAAFDGDSAIRWSYSSDGGSTWSAVQVLDGGADPKTDNDLLGRAHIVYMASPATTIKYRMWNGSSWSAAETVSPATRWQGWPDVGVATDGTAYAVYGDGDIWAQDVVKFTGSVDTDTAPPGQVANLTANPGDGKVYLSWTNPADPDYAATIIRCRADSYPSSPNDGTLVYNGTGNSFTHEGLANGVEYYYSAFARDHRPNYSAAVHARAKPLGMTCAYVRTLPDGSTVDIKNAIVSAVFSADGAIYIQDANRAAGLRIPFPGTGLAVGDRVNATGTMSTRTLSGLPSERQITIGLVTRLSGGSPPQPMAMPNLAVGGAPAGPLVPGVINGTGANNIGLLVRTYGKVTYRSGNLIHVDDGSGIIDPSGRVGVMVKCPSSSIPVAVGDTVKVTGVVVGSIAVGQDTNRRLIQIRDYGDLVVVR